MRYTNKGYCLIIMQKLKIIIFGFVEKLLCGNSPKGAQKYIAEYTLNTRFSSLAFIYENASILDRVIL